MPRVLICPAAGKLSLDHLGRTVKNSITLDFIADFVSDTQRQELGAVYPAGRAWVWGLRPGEVNDTTFDQLGLGDTVCFFTAEGLRFTATVTHKLESETLADHLWQRGPDGRPFSKDLLS